MEITLTGGITRPPKPLDAKTEAMLHLFGEDVGWEETGGVNDGNLLAALGLPVLDSVGVCGGNLHSPDEYVELDSLADRTQRSVALLTKFAQGDLWTN